MDPRRGFGCRVFSPCGRDTWKSAPITSTAHRRVRALALRNPETRGAGWTHVLLVGGGPGSYIAMPVVKVTAVPRTDSTRPGRNSFRMARLVLLIGGAGIVAPGSVWGQEPPTPVLEPLAPPADMQPLSERLDAAQAFRRAFGLRAERRFVRRIESNLRFGDIGRETWSVALTTAEKRDLDRRMRVRRGVPRIPDYGAARPLSFAGVYIDQRRGGRVMVGFTRNLVQHRARLKRLFPFKQSLELFAARFSLRELQAIERRVIARREAARRRGLEISMVAISVPKNTVEVWLSESSRDATPRLRALFGPAVVARRAGGSVTDPETARHAAKYDTPVLYDSYPPMFGGLAIRGASGANCTAGFMATLGAASYLITAGNCGAMGESFTWNGRPLGSVDLRTGQTNNDPAYVERITLPTIARSNRVALSTADPVRDHRRILGSQPDLVDVVGDPICRTDPAAGYACGTVTNINATIDCLNCSPRVLITKQRLARILPLAGGRGDPTFFGNTALGIAWAYVPTTGETIYSHISHSLSQLGLDLATSSYLDELLAGFVPQLRYDAQEKFTAISAASITDNFYVDAAGTHLNALKRADGTIIATSDPASTPRLGLGFLEGAIYSTGESSSESNYIDQDDDRAEAARRFQDPLQAPAYANRIYGRWLKDRTTPGGRVWLAYWFWYYYNDPEYVNLPDPGGNHEGDWEGILIGLNQATLQPEQAIYYTHGNPVRCEWSVVEKDETSQRPIVWVAQGSHASYFRQRDPLAGLDPARGDGLAVVPTLEDIDEAFGWVRWPGRWGGSMFPGAGPVKLPGPERESPAGPAQQRQWNPLYAWTSSEERLCELG